MTVNDDGMMKKKIHLLRNIPSLGVLLRRLPADGDYVAANSNILVDDVIIYIYLFILYIFTIIYNNNIDHAQRHSRYSTEALKYV